MRCKRLFGSSDARSSFCLELPENLRPSAEQPSTPRHAHTRSKSSLHSVTASDDGAPVSTKRGPSKLSIDTTAADPEDDLRASKRGSGSSTASSAKRASDEFGDVMQALCVETMASYQCLVSTTRIDPLAASAAHAPSMPTMPQSAPLPSAVTSLGASIGSESGLNTPHSASTPYFSMQPPTTVSSGYNLHLSGGYQQVMAARGAILRDNPLKVQSRVASPI